MIKKIHLENYRGFKDHSIEFKNTNIIVGKNNAGKSTLVEALRIVSLIARRYKNLAFRNKPRWITRRAQKGIYPSIDFTDINKETLFHNYGEPPAYLEVIFDNGIKFEISIGEGAEIFCQILDKKGAIVKTKKAAESLFIQKVQILPQIKPLQESEDILNEDYVKSHLFSSRSSLHFRNQLHYFNGFYTNFKNIAEETWPSLRINELIVNKNMLGKGRIDLLVQDEKFVSEIGWMGDGLQMWLQTMWFLALSKNGETVILDEPDVYMHPDLQRRLVRYIKNQFKQIIIATHSVEIISEVDPSDILVLDKSQKKSKFTTSLPAVQSVIDSFGTVHNLQLARLWTAEKLILVEGSDIKILKLFQNILYPESLEPLDVIPNMSIGGWGGWNYAIGSSMLLKNSVNEDVIVYCILDSDYHSQSEKEKRLVEAKERGVSLHILERKEIENYLLNPNVIYRYIQSNKQNNLPVTNESVEKQIENVAESLKTEAIDQLATTISNENKTFTAATVNKKAREKIDELWLKFESKVGIISGKEALKLISLWCLENYQTTIQPAKLVSYFKLNDIPEELKYVIESIENSKRFH